MLGFQLPKDMDANKSYISVRNDDVVLGLEKMGNLSQNHSLSALHGQQVGLGIEIVLEVEDLQEAHNNVVSKEYPIQNEITKRPWDWRVSE
ncbi:hypothetical protein [Virgibacillus sp. Bac330]|uniref:hypothetical protein n=1 Tax=Virgibacillus sp. Bac330 TaxID=2419841 RepID=UPI000EF4CFD0|nr:hypothetical protein [Virgibacillus sp. Bac330]